LFPLCRQVRSIQLPAAILACDFPLSAARAQRAPFCRFVVTDCTIRAPPVAGLTCDTAL